MVRIGGARHSGTIGASQSRFKHLNAEDDEGKLHVVSQGDNNSQERGVDTARLFLIRKCARYLILLNFTGFPIQ